jgi:hypothetical protein
MDALLWSFAEQLRATRMLGELGLLDDEEWRVRVNAASAFYLANDYGAAWWANYVAGNGNHALDADLITAINARLSQVDNDFTTYHFKNINELINQQVRGVI